MSIKFVTFEDVRDVHIESTIHKGYKYLIETNSQRQLEFYSVKIKTLPKLSSEQEKGIFFSVNSEETCKVIKDISGFYTILYILTFQ